MDAACRESGLVWAQMWCMFVVVAGSLRVLLLCLRGCFRSRLSHAYANLDCWVALLLSYYFSSFLSFDFFSLFVSAVRVPRVCVSLEPGPSRAKGCSWRRVLGQSRAVVVNSNMSRGKYLAREGPGSRLECACAKSLIVHNQELDVTLPVPGVR